MKRLLFITLLASAAALLFSFRPPTAPLFQFRKVTNTAFKPGEKLVFRIHYGIITAGTATFQIAPTLTSVSGRDCYKISVEGRTAAAFEWFYKVRDYFDTYIDYEALAPLKYRREINEGSFHWQDEVFFDHANLSIKNSTKTFKAPIYTQDMISAFYYARTMDLSKMTPGVVYRMPTFIDDGVYELGLKILGTEIIDTEFGYMRCIKIAPLVVVGEVFKGEEDMIVYVTDDANHLPVRIESPIIVGSIKADLISYSGLRNPVTCKYDD